MQTVTIATGLNVSPLILGLAMSGVSYSEDEAFRLWDRFVELGCNCFDTARVYSDWVPGEPHRSERILGDWIKARNNRDQVVVCTKGAHPPLGDWDTHRLGRQDIHDDLNGSLETLRVDTIDLYYLHMDAVEVPVDEIIDILNEQVSDGRVRYLGCSNWSPARIGAANQYAADTGKQGFVAHEVFWNIGSSNLRQGRSHLPELTKDGWKELSRWEMTATAYTSQAQGYFSKIAGSDRAAVEKVQQGIYYTSENEQLAALLRKISTDHDCTVNQVVVAFLLSQRLKTAAIIGSRTIKQLEDSRRSVDLSLSEAELERLRDAANQTWLS